MAAAKSDQSMADARAAIADFLAAQWRCHMPAPAHWRLHGGTTTVLYDTTGPGTLHYVHPPMSLAFNGPQIRVVANPDLGTLVSVTLSVSPVAETTFTVLLPTVVVDAAHPVEPVQTEGITTNHLLFPPLGQKEFYAVTPLTGVAAL